MPTQQLISSNNTSPPQPPQSGTIFNSIRFKLSLMAAIPLLFALILTAGWLATSYKTYSNMSDYDQLVQFASHASVYMHQTQKERGATGVFVGSDGTQFQEQLAKQRIATDSARAALSRYLSTYNARVGIEKFNQEMTAIIQGIDLLDDHREKIDNLAISSKEAIDFYTNHNAIMLAVISRVARLGYDSQLAITCAAYESLLKGKEQAGIERVTLSVAFALGQFKTDGVSHLASLIATQDNHFNDFLEFTTPQHASFYKKTLANSHINEVQRMRNIAFAEGFSQKLQIQLLTELSFGGLIHNFKNYLIRFDPLYAQRFKGNYQRATQALQQLSATAKTPQTIEAYSTIQHMLNDYNEAIANVTFSHQQNEPIDEIDKLVKIDDGPALAALAQLSYSAQSNNLSVNASQWFNSMTQKINLLKKVEDRLTEDLLVKVSNLRNNARSSLALISLIATIITFAVLIAAYVISNQIVRPIEQLSFAAKQIALGDLNQTLQNNTTDEIGELATSFSSMVQNLQSSFDDLGQANTQLEQMASTDKLTGLPNRVVFNDRLYQILAQSHRNKSKFAVLFFDFDRFKVVNDSLGHHIGDALLCDIADIFRKELRETDTAARFGGDEFVVLLTNLTDWADAETKAQKFIDIFAKPHFLNGHAVVTTASIGLVTNHISYQTPEEFLRDADIALYQAKDKGKNQVAIFDSQMHDEALDRLLLEADLRIALNEKQFKVLYQPIIDMENGQLSGFEALIRWEHPIRGTISPLDFIPIAEETGLIVDIGKWTLRTAAAQIADWNKNPNLDHMLKVNVNISKRQLINEDFLNDALTCQRDFDLRPGELLLEITESIIADDRADSIRLLKQLRDHGFPIVMDDFGTGVSSLGTLHNYPIDILKIDQAFIRALDQDRSLLAVVASITNLADNLGIPTVAEGIETSEIVGALQSVGCKWGQGYHFARPMPAKDVKAYILNQKKHQEIDATQALLNPSHA